MNYGKVACYLRVSSDDQKTDSQIPTVKRWLTNHGYARKDVLWIEDKITAAHLKRPGIEQLEKAIFMGEVDTVVIYHANRLSRSYLDGVTTLDKWWKKGVRVVSINQQIDMDSVMGQAVNGLYFAMAQTEREDLRQRQREGIKLAKVKGVYKGRQPGALKRRKEGSKNDTLKKLAELIGKGNKIADICSVLDIGRTTYYRYRKLAEEEGFLSK